MHLEAVRTPEKAPKRSFQKKTRFPDTHNLRHPPKIQDFLKDILFLLKIFRLEYNFSSFNTLADMRAVKASITLASQFIRTAVGIALKVELTFLI